MKDNLIIEASNYLIFEDMKIKIKPCLSLKGTKNSNPISNNLLQDKDYHDENISLHNFERTKNKEKNMNQELISRFIEIDAL